MTTAPAQRRANPWSAAELDKLESLIGDVPSSMAVAQFNAWAVRHNYPRRTPGAILKRAFEMGLETRATCTWITTGQIAIYLSVPPGTVYGWFNRHPVRSRMEGRRRYIHRADLRAWAQQHPSLLGGQPRGALVVLLEDEALADWICETHRRRPTETAPRRVRCIQTRRIYPSIRAAAAATFLTHTSICRALQRPSSSVAGIQFEVVS